MSDPEFATLGEEGSPWTVGEGARAVCQEDRLVLGRDSGYAMVWQDLPAEALEPGVFLTASVRCRLRDLDGGRGAWLSLHFYDLAGKRVADAPSATLAWTGEEAALRARTHAPPGVRRAAFVLVVEGRCEAEFSAPALEWAAPAPPVEGAYASCKLRGGFAAERWLGVGVDAGLADPPPWASDEGLRPAALRLTVPWSDMGEFGVGPGARTLGRIGSWLAATRGSGCPVELALTGGASHHFSDPERCALWVAGLLEAGRALPGGERIRWVCPEERPGRTAAVDGALYAECLQALAALSLPECLASGPADLEEALWARRMAPVLKESGGALTADLALPARDLGLAEAALAERVGAGARIGLVTAGGGGALEHMALVAQAANAGYELPFAPLGAFSREGWTQALAALTPGPRGGRIRRLEGEAPPGVALLLLEEPSGRRTLLAVNRLEGPVTLEAEIAGRGRSGMLRLRFGADGAPAPEGPTRVSASSGRLGDLVGGRSMTLYVPRN